MPQALDDAEWRERVREGRRADLDRGRAGHEELERVVRVGDATGAMIGIETACAT